MRSIAAAVLIVVIAVGGWWYASPLWTLHAMQAAANNRNEATLSAYVDYPALREDLKGELRGDMLSKASKGGEAGQALAGAIANAFLAPVVDAVVSPQGVEAMFAAQGAGASSSVRRLVPVTVGDHPVIERDGFGSFRVHGEDASKGALLFRREGLGWKLVGIDLPRH